MAADTEREGRFERVCSVSLPQDESTDRAEGRDRGSGVQLAACSFRVAKESQADGPTDPQTQTTGVRAGLEVLM